MPLAAIYCFCSHQDKTVSWWAGIVTGGRGQERREYLKGVMENSTTGKGILTGILGALSKLDAGSTVNVFTTVGQNLIGGEHRELKAEVRQMCDRKALKATFSVVDSDEAQIRSGRLKLDEPVSTGRWIQGSTTCKCGEQIKTEFLAFYKKQHKQFQCTSCGEQVRCFYEAEGEVTNG